MSTRPTRSRQRPPRAGVPPATANPGRSAPQEGPPSARSGVALPTTGRGRGGGAGVPINTSEQGPLNLRAIYDERAHAPPHRPIGSAPPPTQSIFWAPLTVASTDLYARRTQDEVEDPDDPGPSVSQAPPNRNRPPSSPDHARSTPDRRNRSDSHPARHPGSGTGDDYEYDPDYPSSPYSVGYGSSVATPSSYSAIFRPDAAPDQNAQGTGSGYQYDPDYPSSPYSVGYGSSVTTPSSYSAIFRQRSPTPQNPIAATPERLYTQIDSNYGSTQGTPPQTTQQREMMRDLRMHAGSPGYHAIFDNLNAPSAHGPPSSPPPGSLPPSSPPVPLSPSSPPIPRPPSSAPLSIGSVASVTDYGGSPTQRPPPGNRNEQGAVIGRSASHGSDRIGEVTSWMRSVQPPTTARSTSHPPTSRAAPTTPPVIAQPPRRPLPMHPTIEGLRATSFLPGRGGRGDIPVFDIYDDATVDPESEGVPNFKHDPTNNLPYAERRYRRGEDEDD
ncbi:hypothetical protein CALVIDRAFT_562007 [Calocera viscosa TUFC12733]|uniref:Uncharacterized protein n=1 Tax=Calocera viscosa (strain TUFC12733) TaxID=1330018 RepID=A0A167P9I5_CALVF|nr:hypothetical protein CALVIDRAFT_562007 [Calocera viscosa TUFC12733]